jgi:alanine dehydrogenase
MVIGVPKEIKNNENRVSILPFGVEDLSKFGHKVIIQSQAGCGSGFTDDDYKKAGALIINSSENIFQQSDLIIKVKEPQPEEIQMIRKNQIIFTYFHFAANANLTKSMRDTKSIDIAYETVQTSEGQLPLLIPMSEVAGRMAIQNGAKCLEGSMGGMGKLLSGVPGVPCANVSVIGGGVVGSNAAKLAAGLGAKVNILDIDMDRLRYLDDIMPSNVFTLYSNKHTIIELLPKTDLLIGSVLLVGAKAPNLVTRNMLSLMQKGSVIIDVAVDQGGCVESCKPTATSIITEPFCISDNIFRVTRLGALAPTSNTLPIRRSVLGNNSIMVCLFEYRVKTLEGIISSKYLNLSISISKILTLAPKPAANLAAFDPTTPPPMTETLAQGTPGTPLSNFPFPPILASRHLAPF